MITSIDFLAQANAQESGVVLLGAIACEDPE